MSSNVKIQDASPVLRPTVTISSGCHHLVRIVVFTVIRRYPSIRKRLIFARILTDRTFRYHTSSVPDKSTFCQRRFPQNSLQINFLLHFLHTCGIIVYTYDISAKRWTIFPCRGRLSGTPPTSVASPVLPYFGVAYAILLFLAKILVLVPCRLPNRAGRTVLHRLGAACAVASVCNLTRFV